VACRRFCMKAWPAMITPALRLRLSPRMGRNIRPIAPSDPEFAALYGRRSDASINRALDDTMWLRRAHSIGHERQHLNLLTHALVVNSLALHRHRQRTSDPPLPYAA